MNDRQVRPTGRTPIRRRSGAATPPRRSGARPAPARATSETRRPATGARPAPRVVARKRGTSEEAKTLAASRRRLVAFVILMVFAFGAIAVRLTFVQTVRAEEYVEFGESQRVHTVPLPARRGAIFDRNGHELALTVDRPTIAANPRLVTDPLAQAEALAPLLDMDLAVLQERLARDAAFVYLARTVDPAVAEQVKALALPGVFMIDEPKRFAPAGDMALSVLGRVGTDNEGLSGLELQYEKRLAGSPGEMVVEQDPSGSEIPGGVRRFDASTRGDDLILTLDRALQYQTESVLTQQILDANARGGMALVMETRTGDILAMANLVANEDGVRPAPHNMALTNVYEPGSVNKLITIAGALEEGLVEPATELSVAGTIRVADHTFSEHDPHPTENWSITDIMANSSNVGSIMIGQQLGKERIDSYLRAFGFGSPTGLEFPGESAGLMLDTDKWSGTSIGTIPIGQGISVTAVQMLAAYNTIANGGEYVPPRLVKATVGPDGKATPVTPGERRRVVSEETSAEVTAMLSEVVRAGTGTLAAIDGYTVAGKTGTARKPLEGKRGYKAGAYMSSFAGFVPSEKPALTAVVILDEPTPIFGGLVAAPAFADITQYGLRQFRIPPPPPTAAPKTDVPAVDPDAAAHADGPLLTPTTAQGTSAGRVRAPSSRSPRP